MIKMREKKLLRDAILDREVEVIKVTCNDNIKRRILDLGIIEGTIIKPVFRSPLGDPTAYEIRGTIIALREEETSNIEVQ